MPADYLRLATCVYEHFSRENPTIYRFAELMASNSAEIIHEVDVGWIWKAVFTYAGPNVARIDVIGSPTLWGQHYFAADVIPVARQCVARIR